jgi:two-component system, sensor histidine kinase PdtaS
MVSKNNSLMIGELLKDYEVIYDNSDSGGYYDIDSEEQNYDLLIIDTSTWSKKRKDLISQKQNQKSIFLPYLLVSSPGDLKLVTKEVWEDFDEVITIPISKTVLLARVKVLLRTRNLSLQVNQLLKDKEMLMKEIHHRVKNNLMIISSLLELQSYHLKDEESIEIFKESQNRAKSMALIHERLYRTDSLKNIEFSEYINTLVEDLFSTYTTDPNKIELIIEMEKMDMDINTSVPLGLIINEMVTNTLKYAFPGGKSGYLKIALHQTDSDYILEVNDNGVGIPEDYNIEESESLGMLLINSLTSQLDGTLELTSKKGTKFKITFPQPKYS